MRDLILFFLCHALRNHEGASARHLASKDSSSEANKILYILQAVGAERCSQETEGCSSGCSVKGKFNGTAPPTPFTIYSREALDHILATKAMVLASNRNGQKR